MTKKHTVYKTVNKVNGKFYFGVHQTANPDDGYLGSGKLIKRAIRKYGAEGFRKEIIAVFEKSQDAYKLERELVGGVIGTELCYNLKAGGEGGFDWINRNGLDLIGRMKGIAAIQEEAKKDPQRLKKIWSDAGLKGLRSPRRKKATHASFAGKKHTEEAKSKIGLANKMLIGEKNSQFGTCWITMNGVNRKIKLIDQEQSVREGWKRGRDYGTED